MLAGAGCGVFGGTTVGTAVALGGFLAGCLGFFPPVAAPSTLSGSRYMSSNKRCLVPMVVRETLQVLSDGSLTLGTHAGL